MKLDQKTTGGILIYENMALYHTQVLVWALNGFYYTSLA